MTRTKYMTKEACKSAQDAVAHEMEVLAGIPLNAASDSEALRMAIKHLSHFYDLLAYDLIEHDKRERQSR